MADHAYDADRLVASLSDCFGVRVPPQLGSEAYDLIQRNLRAEGFLDDFHAEEVFSMALTYAVQILHSRGGGESWRPRAWLHALCRRACVGYLQAVAVHAPCVGPADRFFPSHSDYADDPLPPRLGGEAYILIKKTLRAEGFLDNLDAEETFSMALTDALQDLHDHGEWQIPEPRAWFHALCQRACVKFLLAAAVQATCAKPDDSCSSSSALQRRPPLWAERVRLREELLMKYRSLLLQLAAVRETKILKSRQAHAPLYDCQHLLARFLHATQQLRPRYRQFLILDIVEGAEAREICEIMKVPSNGAFRRLRRDAFKALRKLSEAPPPLAPLS